MNIQIIWITLNVICGICLGLYFKNIALLFLIIYVLICTLICIKLNNKKIFLVGLFICLLFFFFTSYQENMYNKLFDFIDSCNGTALVISNIEEKTYKNKYIVKIKSLNGKTIFKNHKLIMYVDKKIDLKYGDVIYFNGDFERAQTQRNPYGFNYERYLRQSKIYRNYKY